MYVALKGIGFRKNLFIALILTFLLPLPSPVQAKDWPFWRGPNRNGITFEKGWDPQALKNGPKILWQANVGEGYSAASVKNGYLYTLGKTDQKNTIYCIEEETGIEVWTFIYDCPVRGYSGTFSTPVIDNGCVYVMDRNGGIHCLEAETGHRRWFVEAIKEFNAIPPKYGFSGSPVINGNQVILNACAYGIALDKHTGKKIWVSPSGKCGYATPVIYAYGNKRCAAIFSHRRINGVSLGTGERLWHFPWIFNDGADSADPVVVGNRIFISTAYRNGATTIDFTNNSPKQLWFKKDIQDEFGSSIYKDGYVYVPHGDTRHRTAYLKCIDFNTGEEMWCRDTGHCSLIYVDEKFVVLNQWGDLLIMEATEKGYKDLVQTKVVQTSGNDRCWTAPVLTNGRLFVRTSKGTLLCVDVSSP